MLARNVLPFKKDTGRLLTLVNLDDILPNNSAGTNVQVSNFRVTHQALLQTDSETVSFELDKVVLVADSIHVGGVTVENGVTLLLRGETPTVVDAVSMKKGKRLACA